MSDKPDQHLIDECDHRVQQYIAELEAELSRGLPSDCIAKESAGYALVKQYWGHKTSAAGVPYMDHIDHGILILNKLGAEDDTRQAFCVHGLFQEDAMLWATYKTKVFQNLSSDVILLAMEYRNMANQWLRRPGWSFKRPPYIPLPKVRQMLIADKVSNCYNLITHYNDRDDRLELMSYFSHWLEHLDVKYEDFSYLLENSDE